MRKREDGGILIQLPRDFIILKWCIHYINKHQYKTEDWLGGRKYICLSSNSKKKYSLSFLNGIKEPELIKKLDIYGYFKDYEVLYRFKEL